MKDKAVKPQKDLLKGIISILDGAYIALNAAELVSLKDRLSIDEMRDDISIMIDKIKAVY